MFVTIRILHTKMRMYPTFIVTLTLMKRSVQTIDSKYQSFHEPTDALSWLLKKVATMEKRRSWREFWIRSFAFLLIPDLMRFFLEYYPKHRLYCFLVRIYTYFEKESEALHYLSKIQGSGLDEVEDSFFLEIESKCYLKFGKYDEAKQSLAKYQAVEQSHIPLIRLMKLESSNNHYDQVKECASKLETFARSNTGALLDMITELEEWDLWEQSVNLITHIYQISWPSQKHAVTLTHNIHSHIIDEAASPFDPKYMIELNAISDSITYPDTLSSDENAQILQEFSYGIRKLTVANPETPNKVDYGFAIAELYLWEAIRCQPIPRIASNIYRDISELYFDVNYQCTTNKVDMYLYTLNESVILDSGNLGTWRKLASLYEVLSEYDKAIHACDTILKEDPENSDAYQLRGIINLIQKSDHRAAIQDLKNAIRYSRGQSLSNYFFLAESLRTSNPERPNESLEICREAEELHHHNHLRPSDVLGHSQDWWMTWLNFSAMANYFALEDYEGSLQYAYTLTKQLHNRSNSIDTPILWAARRIPDILTKLGYPSSDVIEAYQTFYNIYERALPDLGTELFTGDGADDVSDYTTALTEACYYMATNSQRDLLSYGLTFSAASKARLYSTLSDIDHNPSDLNTEHLIDLALHRRSTVLNRPDHPDRDRANDPESTDRTRSEALSTFRTSSHSGLFRFYPELEPLQGPAPRKSRFSLSRLQKKLGQGEAFLELKFRNSEPTVLMAFLVTTDGIVATNVWYQDEPRSDSDPISLQDWFDEVLSVLGVHPQAESRATHMLSSLSNDVLDHWGNILFGPFADHLTDIHRLWISPDSFTTQIPFASLPFPDGIEREVAITPSADMFLKPTSRSPRPKPRFTLGVLAADTGDIPLKLQKAETALLRKTVSTPSRRWELSENLPGMEPTLTNLRNIQGLTRCLVISCHGFGPHSDWGTLSIGTTDNPHHVTGRELVDRFLLGDNIGQMEVDLLITSACLTSQIDIDRPEEWLGLPLALQTIWKTRTMILTLWEVAELPSVLWTHSIVNLLTSGIPVGRAFHMAQKQLRDMTRDEASLLLSSILDLLPDPQKGRAASEWADFISRSDNCPFQDPVHWAPFTLIGDPSLKISRSRQMDLSYAGG